MTELGERREVASRPGTEIDDRERRFTLDGSQQRFDVLADVVIARALRVPAAVPKVGKLRDGTCGGRLITQRGECIDEHP